MFSTDYFYCKYSRRNANSCHALRRVKRNIETGEILVLQNYEHSEHFSQHGLSTETKEYIRPRVQMRQTASRIRDGILVFIIQIKFYVKNLARTKCSADDETSSKFCRL